LCPYWSPYTASVFTAERPPNKTVHCKGHPTSCWVSLVLERRCAIRNRENFIGLWLNDREYAHLKMQCEISGLSVSACIRKAIMGVQLRPRPPDSYAKLLRELAAIGNNINQIAYWANSRKGIFESEIIDAARLAKEAYRLIKESV